MCSSILNFHKCVIAIQQDWYQDSLVGTLLASVLVILMLTKLFITLTFLYLSVSLSSPSLEYQSFAQKLLCYKILTRIHDMMWCVIELRRKIDSSKVGFISLTRIFFFFYRDGRASGSNKMESQRIGDIMLKNMSMLKVCDYISNWGKFPLILLNIYFSYSCLIMSHNLNFLKKVCEFKDLKSVITPQWS